MSTQRASTMLPVAPRPELGDWDAQRSAASLVDQRHRLDVIIVRVCRFLGVEWDELMGTGRRSVVVRARELIAHMARRHTTLSFPEIAGGLHRPTHTTCLIAFQRLDAALKLDLAEQPRVDIGGVSLPISEVYARIEQTLRAPSSKWGGA